MSVWALVLGSIGFVGALLTYSVQRALDRQHAVLAERRKLYEECAAALAALMYKQINVNSEIHTQRRDGLNIVGARVFVIAPVAVRQAFSEVIEHFTEKEATSDDEGMVAEFFDDKARALVDKLLVEMRKDALPPALWFK